MQNFVRLVENIPLIPLLDQMMESAYGIESPGVGREILRNERGADTNMMLPKQKELALATMQMVNGSMLMAVQMVRLETGKKALPKWLADPEQRDQSHYVAVALAQPGSLYQSGDETINLRGGEIWRVVPNTEEMLMNNGSDDLIALLIQARTD